MRVRRHLLVDDTVMVDDSMVVDDTMRVDHPMVFDYIMEVDNTVVTLRLLDWSECVWRGARHACEFHLVLYVSISIVLLLRFGTLLCFSISDVVCLFLEIIVILEVRNFNLAF